MDVFDFETESEDSGLDEGYCTCIELKSPLVLQQMRCGREPSNRTTHLHNVCTWNRSPVFWLRCNDCLTLEERFEKALTSRNLRKRPTPGIYSPPYVSLREIYARLSVCFFHQLCPHAQSMVKDELLDRPVALGQPCDICGDTFTVPDELRIDGANLEDYRADWRAHCGWMLREPPLADDLAVWE